MHGLFPCQQVPGHYVKNVASAFQIRGEVMSCVNIVVTLMKILDERTGCRNLRPFGFRGFVIKERGEKGGVREREGGERGGGAYI